MRFGLIHRIFTNVLAALGIFALVSTASLPVPTNITMCVAIALAMIAPESWQARPTIRFLSSLAPIVLFAIEVVRLLMGVSPIDVAIEFAGFLQVVRVLTRRGAAHDQQIIVLALLHFIAGTVLGGSLSYGVCFIGFVLITPGALVLSHLRREVEGNYRQGARDRTGLPVDVPRILRSRRVVGSGFLGATVLLALPMLAFTGALFVLFPRVGLSFMLFNANRGSRMIGFSDHVDLGQVGTLRSDPAVALRFHLSRLPSPPPLVFAKRLRGTAFDTYDGKAWSRSTSVRAPLAKNLNCVRTEYVQADADSAIQFDVEPLDPPVLFLPEGHAEICFPAQPSVSRSDWQLTRVELTRGSEDDYRYANSDGHGIQYRVLHAEKPHQIRTTIAGSEIVRHLTLPSNVSPRIRELALSWTQNASTPRSKARLIEERLKRDYTYDTSTPSGAFPDPLAHFLFESRRGHCEYFSTAMAVMLRMLDVPVPSRNVTGFVGGTYNRFGGFYAVREGDAHSWVEGYFEDEQGVGWTTFDPTPVSGAQPLASPTGVQGYMRDLVDAMAMRWNRYVVSYSQETQASVYREILLAFDRRRSNATTSQGWRTFQRGAVVLLVALGLVFLYLRQRRRQTGPDGPLPPVRKAAATAASLYRQLEGALLEHGITRPLSVTPNQLAKALGEESHPLADEVNAVTHTYERARFSVAGVSDDELRDAKRRISLIRKRSANDVRLSESAKKQEAEEQEGNAGK